MRIVIALASGARDISGVQRHALNLASCLLTRPEIAEVHLVVAPWQQRLLEDAGLSRDSRLQLHVAPIGTNAWSRNFWFYTGLPKLAARVDADIVHLAYPAPLRRRAFRCPTVVTLHDLYPYEIPENFGFPKVHFNRVVLRQCLSQADAIACVSASTLSRLRALDERSAARKARVLPNAIQPSLEPELETPIPAVQGHPFLLCVAQHRRNKNILLVLRSFERLLNHGQLALGTRLLIVGIPGPETEAIQSFIASHDLSGQVRLLQGIPEAQLQWCYRHCSVLLAPSITEGFGLPVAEGLLTGCRIVCSDIPAFRELGGACRYVTLGTGEEVAFAAAVDAAMLQPAPGPIQLPQFSVAAVARGCLELYRSLAALSRKIAVRSSLQSTQEGRRFL